jgi:hypothetical protein
MKTYSSNQFTYDKESDTFIAEASDLQFFDGTSFHIRSQRTGQVKMFLVTRREFTSGEDREFVAWHGKARDCAHRVTVFND